MKRKALYVIVFVTALVAFGTPSTAAVIDLSSGVPQMESATESSHVTMLQMQNDIASPFSGQSSQNGGAGSKYIKASDVVSNISVTTISPLTFAIVIGLVNNNVPVRSSELDFVPRRTVLHEVLFSTIISPNAP
jgi:hypothetical protein